MITRVLPVTPESLQEAAELIREGQVVGFPTETVYGLGANALNGSAVQKIFEAKGRPGDNPLIVHITEVDQIPPLIAGSIPENAYKLADAFWPGPLTMIFPKSSRIPKEVSAGLSTVGIRMPSHPDARAFIQACGVPIAAPSANRSGRPSPTTAAHVLEDMDGRIPLILDGGSCGVGLESTVLDLSDKPVNILRPGGITPEEISSCLGAVKVDGSVLRPLREGEVARSPGMKYRHYAPRGNMTIVRGSSPAVQNKISELYDACLKADEIPCILALNPHIPQYGNRKVFPLGTTTEEAASNLFAALRAMDDEGIDHIFSEAVSTEGVGLAVMNRMGRAAAFHVLDADEPTL